MFNTLTPNFSFNQQIKHYFKLVIIDHQAILFLIIQILQSVKRFIQTPLFIQLRKLESLILWNTLMNLLYQSRKKMFSSLKKTNSFLLLLQYSVYRVTSCNFIITFLILKCKFLNSVQLNTINFVNTKIICVNITISFTIYDLLCYILKTREYNLGFQSAKCFNLQTVAAQLFCSNFSREITITCFKLLFNVIKLLGRLFYNFRVSLALIVYFGTNLDDGKCFDIVQTSYKVKTLFIHYYLLEKFI